MGKGVFLDMKVCSVFGTQNYFNIIKHEVVNVLKFVAICLHFVSQYDPQENVFYSDGPPPLNDCEGNTWCVGNF